MGTSNGKILVYDDIYNNYQEINAWEIDECFPIADINLLERRIISDIVNISIRLEGAYGERNIIYDNIDLFDLKFIQYYNVIENFLLDFHDPIYLLIVEDQVKLKNRIRSHKGLLSREIKEASQFIESEVVVKESYSIIIAMIKLEKNNISYLSKLLKKRISGIIVSKNENIFSKQFLNGVPFEFMTHKEISCLNYLKLIERLCPEGDIVCRNGGDGGDIEINFQIFCNSQKKDLLIIQSEKALATL